MRTQIETQHVKPGMRLMVPVLVGSKPKRPTLVTATERTHPELIRIYFGDIYYSVSNTHSWTRTDQS